ncbi:hypothetical protein [Aliikangiella coralliicola]|uniref:Uncharacterized protein n=1 Tax=Aliikangiella coralliicola TaxID=2592383 RepID=A0A545UC96_9GAMM|nr:hypothetical protein [Aliikangiella coralliicola]TQV87086.1 hypothetical protein FLL46_14875 [Aliikangiella coralliicola]
MHIIIFAALAVTLYWYFSRNAKRAAVVCDFEKDLLRACRGDREKLERLLRHEQSINPSISRTEAAEIALHRYKRDQ